MREQQYLGALVRQFEDRRLGSLDPRDIAGRSFVHRQIEIDAHKRDLAGDVAKIGAKVVEGLEASQFLSPSSFRRRPESRSIDDWTPACAGVTITFIAIPPSPWRCRSSGWRSPTRYH